MVDAAEQSDFTLIIGGIHAGRHDFARSLAGELALPVRSHGWRDCQPGESIDGDIDPAEAVSGYRGAGLLLLLADIAPWLQDRTNAASAADRLIGAIAESTGPLVVVSREAGLGIVPLDPSQRQGRDDLGRMNQALAALAGRVVFVAAGLPLNLKGTP